jgi:hypothetical protein
LFAARLCDKYGTFLDDGMTSPQSQPHDPNDWAPYGSCLEFETAQFLFQHAKMSAANIDTLMKLWKTSLAPSGSEPPFDNHKDLYDTIDATQLGGVPWDHFVITYNGQQPETNVPSWMEQEYEVYFRDPHKLFLEMLANPSFVDGFDYMPVQVLDSNRGRSYENFMSGNWAWKQAVSIPFPCSWLVLLIEDM